MGLLGGLGAAVSIGSSLLGGKKASGSLQDGANAAGALQKQIYKQTRTDNQPYMQAGSAGVKKLSTLLGLSGPDTASLAPQLALKYNTGKVNPNAAKTYYYEDPTTGKIVSAPKLAGGQQSLFYTQNDFDLAGLNAELDAARTAAEGEEGYGSLLDPFSIEDYEEDPGYKFRLQQGNQALDRANAARGNFLSGAAIKGALDFNSGLASQEYGAAFDRDNINKTNIYNRLMGITGVGQQANNTVANAGQNYANQASEYLTQGANAKAAGQANVGSLLGNLLGGSQYTNGSAQNYGTNMASLSRLFGGF
jgi:hypothetical protein